MQRHLAKAIFVLTSAMLLASTAVFPQELPVETGVVRGVTATDAAISEESCEILASENGEKAELHEAPGVHVLDKTDVKPLVLKSTPGVEIRGLLCWRSEARLARFDYIVPQKLRIPLFIKSNTGDEAVDRTIKLQKVNGSFRVLLLHGPAWTPEENEEVTRAITSYDARIAKE